MNILIVCPSRSSITQAMQLAKGLPSFRFTIFTEYVPKSLSGVPNENWDVLTSQAEVMRKIVQYDKLITFGVTSHVAHTPAYYFSVLFSQLSRQRMDIQHGLYQEGYTLPLGTQELLTDYTITWKDYGCLLPEVARIEYPRFAIGISSNLHWHIYSEQERSLFRRSIAELAAAFPSYRLVWRPHPADFPYVPGQIPTFNSLGVRARNLSIQSFADIDRSDIEEFLSGIDLLITTPSTTIVDAQRSKIPCIMFDARGLRAYDEGVPNFPKWRQPKSLMTLSEVALKGAAVSASRDYKRFDFVKLETLLRKDQKERQSISRESAVAMAFNLANSFGYPR